MKVYAFVGTSGSGKSHRAQMVAKEYGLNYIIDDALLIKGNKVVAGVSAKKAETKIASVKQALFSRPGQKEEIDRYRQREEIDSILILGTSDNMVNQIVNNLGFPPIEKTIYIEDVATPEEIQTAKNVRQVEGKHVIPVPTFELKKDFSGYLLDSLQIFKKSKDNKMFISEKSIIRPTYTYIGDYNISINVFRQFAQYNSDKIEGVYKTTKVEANSYNEGVIIKVEVILNYGFDIRQTMKELKDAIKYDIEKYTSMNVFDIIVTAKSINTDSLNKK
ncbi:MAG: Asp23/Gls24 family envelope stress response protein [Clostridiales bacterium]|nr:Asp23/Gls24 family envelope stress response protein [Clostridiales bacterium]